MANHSYEFALALGVLSPLISFWVLVFFGPKMGKPLSGWFGVIMGMGVPLALSTYVLLGWLGLDPAARDALTANAFRWHWADIGSVPVTIGVKLDSLTVATYFKVTFIAFWIFFFSVGYMAGHSDEVAHQRKYWRFFAYLSLFGFSMLGLVISSSLLFLFIFWELVGLCSYLLIGYYFDQRVPQYAQMKAFITNRVGDFGFLIGLMLVFFQLGTLDLDQAAANFAEQFATHSGIFASTWTIFGWSLATVMGIGLFCGAMGKSAQFPLHVWLPDAMAGPTPVSALIHAATMVAAGVYLVARVFRLMTPDALMFVAAIGCITLFLMALIAIVQTDIKKCLAYSTLSQLGYMIFGMGCGAWIAALFHLITHAFFKAMMFLGSGQVIEGTHHEQDMRKMGGLLKKMPVTGFTFLIGVLAIAGAGIPGTLIGLGGFHSKDEILAVAYARAFEWTDFKRFESHESGHGESQGGSAHASLPPHQGGIEGGLRTPSASLGLAVAGDGRFVLVGDPDPKNPINNDPLKPSGEYSDAEIQWLAERGGKDPSIGLLNMPRPIVFDDDRKIARVLHEILHARNSGTPTFQSQTELWGPEARAIRFLRQFGAQRSERILKHLSEADRRRMASAQSQHAGQSGTTNSQHGAGSPNSEHAPSHGDFAKAAMFRRIPKLPKWMFWLAIATAYITPFYMMRAWWMTFMGQPRDHHVYDHAHESPLMYIPLVVLAAGTFVSSYFLFRDQIADAARAATAAPLVLGIDGAEHTPAITAAHHWLVTGVGLAFVVGFVIAILIYLKGLTVAERMRRLPGFSHAHFVLVNKYFIDELYHLVFVRGTVGLARLCRFIDTWVVDLIFNLAASATERFAAFSGNVLDKHGIDGFFNGLSKTSFDFSDMVRGPQTGRIRNYVLFAAGAATIIVVALLWFGMQSGPASTTAAAF